MFQTIMSLWLLAVLVLSFSNLKWGIALFLAYMILVPYMKLNLGDFQLGENLFPFAFLIGYFVYVKQKGLKTDWKPLMPFIVYYIVCLCMIPFQGYVPFDVMINSWRISVMSTLLLPFVLWNYIKSDIQSILLFRKTFLVCIVIAIGYGLFLTTLGGANPYIMSLMDLINAKQDYEGYYLAEGTGRMFGRISSVFVHPMSFALFIGLSFIYLFYIRREVNKYIFVIILLAISVMSILCGVRSVLGGLAVAVAYYFLIGHNYKMMFTALIVGVVGYEVLSYIPELADYVGSIADINNQSNTVRGSSIEMRMDQFKGAWNEASKSPLFGLGFDWTRYYQSLNGDHPICLAFESLIFVITCNQGIIGYFLWIIMILWFLKYNNNNKLQESVILNSLMIFYISYSCITGEYGYMKMFLIFYILMMGEALLKQSNTSISSK